jgi:hypothetical protein
LREGIGDNSLLGITIVGLSFNCTTTSCPICRVTVNGFIIALALAFSGEFGEYDECSLLE